MSSNKNIRKSFVLDLRYKVAEERNLATVHNNHADSLERQAQASRAEAADHTARADQWQQLLDFAELVDADRNLAVAFAEAQQDRSLAAVLADPAADSEAENDEPDTGYTDAQLDGNACIRCGGDFRIGEASEPCGAVSDGGQLFAHVACRNEDVTA